MRTMRNAKKAAIRAIQTQQAPQVKKSKSPPSKPVDEPVKHANDSSNSGHSLRSTSTVAAVALPCVTPSSKKASFSDEAPKDASSPKATAADPSAHPPLADTTSISPDSLSAPHDGVKLHPEDHVARTQSPAPTEPVHELPPASPRQSCRNAPQASSEACRDLQASIHPEGVTPTDPRLSGTPAPAATGATPASAADLFSMLSQMAALTNMCLPEAEAPKPMLQLYQQLKSSVIPSSAPVQRRPLGRGLSLEEVYADVDDGYPDGEAAAPQFSENAQFSERWRDDVTDFEMMPVDSDADHCWPADDDPMEPMPLHYSMTPVAMEFDFAPTPPLPFNTPPAAPACCISAVEPPAADGVTARDVPCNAPANDPMHRDLPGCDADARASPSCDLTASEPQSRGLPACEGPTSDPPPCSTASPSPLARPPATAPPHRGSGLAYTNPQSQRGLRGGDAVDPLMPAVTAAEVAPKVPNVYAVLGKGPSLDTRAMLPAQPTHDNASSPVGRRSGREKKLSAKATAVAMVAQRAAEDRERKFLEQRAAEAAAQVEAVQHAAGVLLDMHLWGDDMHELHAIRVKVDAQARENTLEAHLRARGCMHAHGASRAGTPPDCLVSTAPHDSEGPLQWLSDIALAEGGEGCREAAAAAAPAAAKHHAQHPADRERHRSSPCSSAWRTLTPSASGPMDAHASASGCDAVTSGLGIGLSWGGKRGRGECSARRRRTDISGLVAAVRAGSAKPSKSKKGGTKRKLQQVAPPKEAPAPKEAAAVTNAAKPSGARARSAPSTAPVAAHSARPSAPPATQTRADTSAATTGQKAPCSGAPVPADTTAAVAVKKQRVLRQRGTSISQSEFAGRNKLERERPTEAKADPSAKTAAAAPAPAATSSATASVTAKLSATGASTASGAGANAASKAPKSESLAKAPKSEEASKARKSVQASKGSKVSGKSENVAPFKGRTLRSGVVGRTVDGPPLACAFSRRKTGQPMRSVAQ